MAQRITAHRSEDNSSAPAHDRSLIRADASLGADTSDSGGHNPRGCTIGSPAVLAGIVNDRHAGKYLLPIEPLQNRGQSQVSLIAPTLLIYFKGNSARASKMRMVTPEHRP